MFTNYANSSQLLHVLLSLKLSTATESINLNAVIIRKKKVKVINIRKVKLYSMKEIV